MTHFQLLPLHAKQQEMRRAKQELGLIVKGGLNGVVSSDSPQLISSSPLSQSFSPSHFQKTGMHCVEPTPQLNSFTRQVLVSERKQSGPYDFIHLNHQMSQLDKQFGELSMLRHVILEFGSLIKSEFPKMSFYVIFGEIIHSNAFQA